MKVHNKMCRLTDTQLQIKTDFINNYIKADNAATASTFDANANVTNKNVGTLFAEINKDINIQIKRSMFHKFIKERFDEATANKYLAQLETHKIYAHDETAFCLPYCVAVDLYPFIENGLTAFGGETKAPKHLSSYNGGFINLVFALSSQFAGAVATPAYLFYFHYFATKEYGEHYLATHSKTIEQELQQVVYALNQPASARGMQCPFWNISIFDKYYFDSIFGKLTYPDGTQCVWNKFNLLQEYFMKWFNKERTKALLTFPVVTVAMLNDGKETYKDEKMFNFIANELHNGNSFFIYTSDSIDALSSCCFHKDEKLLFKINNVIKYDTFEHIYDAIKANTIQVFNNGKWVNAHVVRRDMPDMYKITMVNGDSYIVTSNHEHVVFNNNNKHIKHTWELTEDDFLAYNKTPLEGIPNSEYSYALGFLVGIGLCLGTYHYDEGKIVFGINIANNKSQRFVLDDINKRISTYFSDAPTIKHILDEYYNISYIYLDKEYNDFFNTYITINDSEDFSPKLNISAILKESTHFRQGLLNAIMNISEGYCINDYTVEDIKVIATSIGYVTVHKEKYSIPTSVLSECPTDKDHITIHKIQVNKDEPTGFLPFVDYISNNDLFYWKIDSIKKWYKPYCEDGPVYCVECEDQSSPYFTLATGLYTHNCRLRNGISDQLNDFSYSLGAGGIMTGSLNVLTLNMNRFIQNCYYELKPTTDDDHIFKHILKMLEDQIYLMHRWQIGIKDYFKWLLDAGMLPAYTGHFIDINKQYLTIGINGLLEGLEFLGYKANNNPEYKAAVNKIFNTISNCNRTTVKEYPDLKLKFNTEVVPSLL